MAKRLGGNEADAAVDSKTYRKLKRKQSRQIRSETNDPGKFSMYFDSL